MLVHRLQRWTNIVPALGQYVVFTGMFQRVDIVAWDILIDVGQSGLITGGN